MNIKDYIKLIILNLSIQFFISSQILIISVVVMFSCLVKTWYLQRREERHSISSLITLVKIIMIENSTVVTYF